MDERLIQILESTMEWSKLLSSGSGDCKDAATTGKEDPMKGDKRMLITPKIKENVGKIAEEVGEGFVYEACCWLCLEETDVVEII